MDAVFEFVKIKEDERQFWDFYLQGTLLSKQIGDCRNFEAAESWGILWKEIFLPVFVSCDEVVNVQLTPQPHAPISGAAGTHFF